MTSTLTISLPADGAPRLICVALSSSGELTSIGASALPDLSDRDFIEFYVSFEEWRRQAGNYFIRPDWVKQEIQERINPSPIPRDLEDLL